MLVNPEDISDGTGHHLDASTDRDSETTERLDRVGYPGKRAMDLVISASLVVLFLPAMIAIALAVRLGSPGPVFFRQQRLGVGGARFNLLKFRTMVLDAEDRLQAVLAGSPDLRAEYAVFHKLAHDPRVTPIGRFLRKTSLDELPQLFNVVAGDMSLVGPRPIVEAEKTYYREYLQHYKSCRPGMTGLWQVSGRSDVGYGERVALDARYVERWSLALDITILARTPVAVVAGSGAY